MSTKGKIINYLDEYFSKKWLQANQIIESIWTSLRTLTKSFVRHGATWTQKSPSK